MKYAAIALCAFLLTTPGVASMTHQRALDLEVIEHGGTIEVTLRGHSRQSQTVDYQLHVRGTSESRHRGSTTLMSGSPVVLSNISVSVGENWCARLSVEEADGASYEIVRGTDCA
jgi:hypothetical protein